MIKRLFNTAIIPKNIDVVLVILRITFGVFMLAHGLPKMEKLFGDDPIQFASVFGLSQTASLALAVFSEVFCSILLIIGFGTRLATIPLIITMLVAALVIHGADPFFDKESSLHYLVVYVVLLIAGPGKYSVDHLISR